MAGPSGVVGRLHESAPPWSRADRHRQHSLAPDGVGGFPNKPHIVLWLTDDQGWANIGYHNEHFYTPHMDKMAQHGVRLHRHYTYPWCAPSRAALMTGRLPHRGFQDAGQRVDRDVRFISHVMRDAGYSTHHIGKWHLGLTRSWQYPTSRGFDSSIGFMGGGVEYVSTRISKHAADDWICPGVDLQKNEGPATGWNGTFSGSWYGSEIDRVIFNRNGDQPMFLYVALQAMHSPTPGVEVLAQFLTHYKELHAGPRFSASAALVTHADELIGKLTRSLWMAKIWDQTLVIHLSDNGGQVNWNEGEVQGNNWPLRGMKRSFFEGGVRTPAFVSGGALPLAARGRVLDGYIHLADWYATLKALAGSTEDAPEGSLSMASYIAGSVEQSPRQELVLAAGDTGTTVNGVEAVIRGEWKLINGSIPCGWATYQGAKFPNASSERTRGFMLPGCMHRTKTYLFNIQTDPHESHNLAESPAHQLKLAELFELLDLARSQAAPFEIDHDRAFDRDTRQRWCEETRDARGGFLGPYMEGKPDRRSEYESSLNDDPRFSRFGVRRRVPGPEPASAEAVYHDTWSEGNQHEGVAQAL